MMSVKIGCSGVVAAATIIALCLSLAFGSLEPELYLFGVDSDDKTLPPSDDGASAELGLSTPFVLYGNSRETLFVNTNGLLSFGGSVTQFSPTAFPLQSLEVIAPYWADVDTRGSGTVFYRETNDTDLLVRIKSCLQEAYPNLNDTLNPNLLFIVTWDNVGYFDQNTDKTNTFQCILVIDGVRSFILFLYAEIEWTTGDASGGENGLGGTPAKAGINAGDGIRHFTIPGSLNETIINITNTSNIGVPGVWVFRADGDSILQPGSLPDVCRSNLDQCDQNAQCLNMSTTFGCFCNPGYSGDGTVCTDIDECSQMAEGEPCTQICTNLPGSFTCGCNDGFILATDGSSCEIAGCESAGFVECCTENCFVEQGNCYCDKNCYNFSDCCDDIMNVCLPANPCALGFHNCSENATCADTDVGFNCTCSPGFTGDGTFCDDVNECDITSPCEQICINIPGSFQCECNETFALASNGLSCVPITNCSSAGFDGCCAVADCFVVLENCHCDELCHTFNDCCEDISETCPPDECRLGRANCDANAMCTDTEEGFNCTCIPGYEGNGTSCSDIDECGLSLCGQNCTNTAGSFFCSCMENYILNPDGLLCIKDECGMGATDNCSSDAQCTNVDTEQGFVCTCNPGYIGNGFTCTDMNECEDEEITFCQQNCTNTIGSFQCSCTEGFILSSDGINCLATGCIGAGFTGCCSASTQQCLVEAGSCFCDATCYDANDCCADIEQTCPPSAADDVDECALGIANCSVDADCTNTVGSFLCSCRQGYTGNGFSCTDIDECNTTMDACSQMCCNTLGSFVCKCSEGFLLDTDGTSCTRGVEISFQQTSYTIVECTGNAEVCVRLNGNLTENITLLLTSEDGTATASEDYLSVSEELRLLPSSDGLVCVDIPILQDNVTENAEFFSVLLSIRSDGSVAIITAGFANVTIADNDNVEATFTEALYNVKEISGSIAVCVSVLGTLECNATLLLRTEDGRAKTPDDYIGINKELSFPSGSNNMTMCVNIIVFLDGIVEDTEQFSVILSTNDSSVMITRGTTAVAITNSDVAVGLLQELFIFSEDVGNAEVCVQLSGEVNENINVMLNTRKGTATRGVDYTQVSEVITFTRKNINPVMCASISIIDDYLAEIPESFSVQLSTTSPSVILRNISATIIILDNDAAVRLVNSTPLVSETSKGTFSVLILLEKLREDIQSVNCRLTSSIQGDCSDGSITFRNLPASRKQPYTLTVRTTLSDGGHTVLTRRIRLGGNGDCAAILIDDGLVINGDSIEVEWQGVGPSTEYDCRLDDNTFVPCASPFEIAGIINGNHRLKIRPLSGNCSRRIRRNFNFPIFQSNTSAPL